MHWAGSCSQQLEHPAGASLGQHLNEAEFGSGSVYVADAWLAASNFVAFVTRGLGAFHIVRLPQDRNKHMGCLGF